MTRNSDPRATEHKRARTPMADQAQQLRAAAAEGDAPAVEALLAAGADAAACDEAGTTALIEAARCNHHGCVRVLAQALKSADQPQVDASDENNLTALSYAAHLGHPESTMALLDFGAEVDRGCSGGSTALLLAAAEGHEQVVEALLEALASTSTKDKEGETALMKACAEGHAGVVSILMVKVRRARV